MCVPNRFHVNAVDIPVGEYRCGNAVEVQEHQWTIVLDKTLPQLSKMYPIGSCQPLCDVHRSVLVYWTSEDVRLLQNILRWLACPDEFGSRR